jgi:hypothetical protein
MLAPEPYVLINVHAINVHAPASNDFAHIAAHVNDLVSITYKFSRGADSVLPARLAGKGEVWI